MYDLMTTSRGRFESAATSGRTVAAHPSPPSPPQAGESCALKLVLCTFQHDANAFVADLMQMELALRYIAQQLSAFGAEVVTLSELEAHGTSLHLLHCDALVVFPAGCASIDRVDALLRKAHRPSLILALGTDFAEDPALTCDYGGAMASVAPGLRAGLCQIYPDLHDGWIEGMLFTPRPWMETGRWLAALRAALAVAHLPAV